MAAKGRFGKGKRHTRMDPLAGGILLDLLDLAALSPFGLTVGWILGAAVAWLIGSAYGFSRGQKMLLSALAAVYCVLPMTEWLPLATILTAAVRLFAKPGGERKPQNGRKQVPSKVIKPEP